MANKELKITSFSGEAMQKGGEQKWLGLVLFFKLTKYIQEVFCSIHSALYLEALNQIRGLP